MVLPLNRGMTRICRYVLKTATQHIKFFKIKYKRQNLGLCVYCDWSDTQGIGTWKTLQIYAKIIISILLLRMIFSIYFKVGRKDKKTTYATFLSESIFLLSSLSHFSSSLHLGSPWTLRVRWGTERVTGWVWRQHWPWWELTEQLLTGIYMTLPGLSNLGPGRSLPTVVILLDTGSRAPKVGLYVPLQSKSVSSWNK